MEEYMPEYREFFGGALVERLARTAWPMVAMAAFCFVWCVYMYVTPPYGGAGLIMITPESGPAGLVTLLPWCSIVMGVLVAVGSLFSRGCAVLKYADVVIAAIMVLVGVVGIFAPASALGSFSSAYSVAGVVLAVYLALVACELLVRGERLWFVELVIAAAVWVISFAGGLNVAADHAQVVFACLAFFVAAWGFVFGAISLVSADR